MATATFWIHEDNEQRMEKYATRYNRKADRTVLRPTGDAEMRTVACDDGVTRTLRFVAWEADDAVIRRDGWTFAATLEHHDGGANVIRRATTDDTVPEIPPRYRTAAPWCDCCKTDRDRRDTYLVYNTQTGAWAQLGRSCLREYTGGLSPAAVASWMAMWDEAVHCAAPSGLGYREYHNTEEILRIASEVVRLHGYAPTACPEDVDPYTYVSTRERVMEHWRAVRGRLGRYDIKAKEHVADDMDRGYDADAVDLSGLLSWVAEQDQTSDYMHNIQVLCASKYCEPRDTGLLCSVPHVYAKAMGRERERKQRPASNHIGTVGERVTLTVHDGKTLTSWETQFGTTYLYKWTTTDGDTVVWKTSKCLYVEDVTEITGTVKEHGEYRGEKQTELTRCKVNKVK